MLRDFDFQSCQRIMRLFRIKKQVQLENIGHASLNEAIVTFSQFVVRTEGAFVLRPFEISAR
jgi:hypothetical protein